tara:strand:+ start:15545 stop:15730 length:186 start_codon:yes stop_codon:yes gene_type:complete
VAVHAQALNYVHDFVAILVSFLRARLGDLSSHVLEKILRKAFVFCHDFDRWWCTVHSGKVK